MTICNIYATIYLSSPNTTRLVKTMAISGQSLSEQPTSMPRAEDKCEQCGSVNIITETCDCDAACGVGYRIFCGDCGKVITSMPCEEEEEPEL